MISGETGQKRDWDRERSLFLPGARLIPTSKAPGSVDRDTKTPLQVLDVEGYIAGVESFFEKERLLREGDRAQDRSNPGIVTRWSTYTNRAIVRMIRSRSCAGSTAFN